MREKPAKIASDNNMILVIMQTSCSKESSINRILRRKKEKYESNALTEEAYLQNKKKFEPVIIEDLKNLYPALKILHFIVDTEYDPPEKWHVIDLEKI